MTSKDPKTQRDLTALRKTAEAATPGPWTEFHENGTPGELEAFNCPPATGAMLVDYAPMEQRMKDVNFIAAFDPPTVLALLDRVEAADDALDFYVAQRKELQTTLSMLADRLDEHSYSELSCLIDDEHYDQWGESYRSKLE